MGFKYILFPIVPQTNKLGQTDQFDHILTKLNLKQPNKTQTGNQFLRPYHLCGNKSHNDKDNTYQQFSRFTY